MTSFKLLGAAFALCALLATPASAWEAISEPAAAAATDPNFNIYSDDSATLGSSRALASQPFNSNAMAEMPMAAKPHRAHHASIKHY